MVQRILITGANGFVGRNLGKYLADQDMTVVMAVRQQTEPSQKAANIEIVQTGRSYGLADWPAILTGCDAVVHLAGRAHIMADHSDDPLAEYRKINVALTEKLAEAAAAAGVKRFIYVSSIKVAAENSGGRAIKEDDRPLLDDPYSISKFEAENRVRAICGRTGMEYVIIRPPLVYGPGVKANFARMIKIVAAKIPLPLAAINNARSMVGITNLLDFICCCLNHENGGGHIFNVSDDDDISTTELITRLATALGVKPRLFRLPAPLLQALCLVTGQKKACSRLTESLQVDISKAKTLLGWLPPVTMAQELVTTIQWYREHKNR